MYAVIHLDMMVCAAHLIGEPNGPISADITHISTLWTSSIHTTSMNTLTIMHTRSHCSYLLSLSAPYLSHDYSNYHYLYLSWLCHLLLCCITCHSCKAITLAGPKPAREKWLARLASGLKFSQPRAQHHTCVWVQPYSVWVYDRY